MRCVGARCNTYHTHLDPISQFQVKLLVSNRRIVLIQLVKLALLEEQDCIEMILLDLPELLLERGHRLERLFRNVNRPLVVFRVVGAFHERVSDLIRSEEMVSVLSFPFGGFLLELASFGVGQHPAVGVSWASSGAGFARLAGFASRHTRQRLRAGTRRRGYR